MGGVIVTCLGSKSGSQAGDGNQSKCQCENRRSSQAEDQSGDSR